jgi:hypothetical protein
LLLALFSQVDQPVRGAVIDGRVNIGFALTCEKKGAEGKKRKGTNEERDGTGRTREGGKKKKRWKAEDEPCRTRKMYCGLIDFL